MSLISASIGRTPAMWGPGVGEDHMPPAMTHPGQQEPGELGRRGNVDREADGLKTQPHWAAYSASKYGLRALAEALREEE